MGLVQNSAQYNIPYLAYAFFRKRLFHRLKDRKKSLRCLLAETTWQINEQNCKLRECKASNMNLV